MDGLVASEDSVLDGNLIDRKDDRIIEYLVVETINMIVYDFTLLELFWLR